MSYRYDKRSEDEFKRDIRSCTLLERSLMERYVNYLNQKDTNKQYVIIDNGTDNSGEFIKNNKDVTLDSDFIIRTDGQSDRKIEIKHCKPNRSAFHLKVNHIKYCIENDVCIVNWMGVETDAPRFCILTPNVLNKVLTQAKIIKFWGKPCIKFKCSDYQWINA